MPKQQLINAFENLNDEESAYWFGYLCGDGSLHSKRDVIFLGSKDLEHLKKYKKFLRLKHKISGSNGYYSISFTSSITYKNLLNLGLTPRKSKTINEKVIPKRNVSHFIRGLFDSDGSIGFYKYENRNLKKASLCFYGNYPLLKHIKIRINDGGSIQKNKPRADSLIYGGRFKVAEVISFLYDNATIYLERKKIISDNILNYNKKFKKYFHYSKYNLFDKNKRPLVESVCENCRTSFTHRADHKNKFCSRKCSIDNMWKKRKRLQDS